MLSQLLLCHILFSLSAAFIKAPGTLTLKIKILELIEGCQSETICQYNLEFCIGSGRSFNEQCLWLPVTKYNGQYHENHESLAQQTFEVDNIRSSFYFNANLTFENNNKIVKNLRFRDSLIQYDAVNGTHILSLHSEKSLTIEIDIKCKLGYYPQFQCTRSCFGTPYISRCDNDGNTVCMKGYALLPSLVECVKNPCSFIPQPCHNNGTCKNEIYSIKCICSPNYTGTFCEIWDPCMKLSCKNFGKCVKRELTKDYTCQCEEGYIGKYCETIVDPCKKKLCPPKTYCRRIENNAMCLTLNISESKVEGIGRLFEERNRKPTFPSLVTEKKAFILDENEIRNRETVKLIQYPVQKDFTTISIIVVLLVFVICCFGVTLWMQRYKYFQKKKKYNNYPNIPPISSIINLPTYRSADENFKRWHSLDDNSFYICHQPQHEQYSTMSYKSGNNLWPRFDTTNDSFKNWPPIFKTRMPMMNESSNFDSGDTTGNLCESTQNNSEKMEDYIPDCLTMNNSNLPVHELSFD